MPISPQELKDTTDWVKKIESTIDDDIPPAMNRGTPRGGYYSSIRLIFCYVDVFGALMTNTTENSSLNAVKFIKVYFKKVNPRYNDIAGILYSIFRHGAVHTFQPKLLFINGRRYGYVIGKDTDVIPNTDSCDFIYKKEENGDGCTYKHLEPKSPDPSWPKAMENPGGQLFPISLEKLLKDLKSAVAYYIDDLENGPDIQLKENAIGMMRKIHTPTEFSLDNNLVVERHPNLRRGEEFRRYIDPTELSKF